MYKLNNLIGSHLYDKAVERIRQEQKNKAYTDAWAQEQTVKLNKEWLGIIRMAVAENNGEIQKKQDEYNRVKSVNFDHQYTPQHLADLQYLQTLIKARILNEGKEQPVLIKQIVEDYIFSQKGARAVMFLANDAEIGEMIKPFYSVAAENARTAAEKRFDEAKAAKLEQMDKALIPLMQNAVIGDAMLKQAEDRVNADISAEAARLYFGGEELAGEKELPKALGNS